jgi:RNA polymerase sigma factor (sigma-70 family)
MNTREEALKLFNKNIPLVHFLIDKNFPDYIHDEDLYQEGCIALWKACLAYDPSVSKISTLAGKYIYNSSLKYIDSLNRRAKHFPQTDISDIASVTGVEDNDDDIYNILFYLNDNDSIPLFLDVEQKVVDNYSYEQLIKFIQTLTPKRRHLLYLKAQGYTFEEIAKIRHTSQQAGSGEIAKIKKKWNNFITQGDNDNAEGKTEKESACQFC